MALPLVVLYAFWGQSGKNEFPQPVGGSETSGSYLGLVHNANTGRYSTYSTYNKYSRGTLATPPQQPTTSTGSEMPTPICQEIRRNSRYLIGVSDCGFIVTEAREIYPT